MATGPGGITPGSYPPQDLSQDQRQWLWEQFGHSGTAPVGYGGEGGSMSYSAGSGAAVNFPTFNFDLEESQKRAYELLKPFYEKIIQFAQGDLDLAKRIVQYTFDQGMRENQQEYQASVAEAGRLTAEETPQLLTEQNRRGILESGFGQQARVRQSARQTARADAIQKAYENRTSRAEKEKEFGTEREERAFEQFKFEQERDRRQEARDIAQTQFGIAQSKYQTQLAQAQQQEAQRVQDLERQAKADFYDQYYQSPIIAEPYIEPQATSQSVTAASTSPTWVPTEQLSGFGKLLQQAGIKYV